MERVRELQEAIVKAMEAGDSIDQIDDELIEPAPISGDRKAALWLYAWSMMDRASQRAAVAWHLDALDEVERTR